MLETILVAGRAYPAVEEDLKRLGVRDILLQFHEGDEAELRKLTTNLRQVRNAERALRQVRAKLRKVDTAQAAAVSLQSTPAGAPSSGSIISAQTTADTDPSPANDGGVPSNAQVGGDQRVPGVGLASGRHIPR